MATAIFLSSENSPSCPAQPECDQASHCAFFVKASSSSPACIHRHDPVCHKRRNDVFAPFEPKKQAAE
ncbi:MAG: hypothetical protein LBV79_08725 [Candidatus Adiutrix sp.]|nr:hypothetical protein [Candidatus Adiutrix sp.]